MLASPVVGFGSGVRSVRNCADRCGNGRRAMFSNIIGTLTSLLPKNFIFSAYVPTLIFGFINLALLYVNVAAFRAWAQPQLVTPLSLTTAVLFVASVVFAYVLTTINDFLREVLEGKFIPIPWLK